MRLSGGSRCIGAFSCLILMTGLTLIPGTNAQNEIARVRTSTSDFDQRTEIERGPRSRSQIALTFDAGADADCFADLITALSNAGVKSTFFITGKWAQANPECTQEITKQGHEIGNHTWSHLDLTTQPDAVVRDEISALKFSHRTLRTEPPPVVASSVWCTKQPSAGNRELPRLQIDLLDDRQPRLSW